MKLDEFVNAKDATNYNPDKDEIDTAHLDDTSPSKKRLTLLDLNGLKKSRALKKLEALKKQDLLSMMYSKSKGGDAGGGFGGPSF